MIEVHECTLVRDPIGTRNWSARQQAIAVIRLIAKPSNYIRVGTAITEGGNATYFECATSSFYFIRRRRLPDEVGISVVTNQWRKQLRRYLLGGCAREAVAGCIKRTGHVFPPSMTCIWFHRLTSY